MRLALLGGSFDPIHVGHLAIAEAALRQERLDGVVFVPARRSPLKGHEPQAGAEDRHQMVRRAIEDVPRMRVSRVELEREPPSYTVDTLRSFAAQAEELFLILGVDAFLRLDEWREPAEVLRLATLLVAPRPRVPDPAAALAETGGRARVLASPLVGISSAHLREHARFGGSLRYLVPDAAWRYAAARGLYGQTLEE